MTVKACGWSAVILIAAAPVFAQDGQTLFQQRCAACHDDGAAPGQAAPPLSGMRKRQIAASTVMRMIDEGGRMATHAGGWSVGDRQRVAEWVAGAPLSRTDVPAGAGRCGGPPPPIDHPFTGGFWNGWGVDTANTRFQPSDRARLKVGDIPKLTLKWAFGYPNGTSAYSQPAVARGRVFVGSDSGLVYALDAKTGCIYWEFKADASVRTAPVLAESRAARSGVLLYVGDFKANVYALDARTGDLVWKQRVEQHPAARITGSPTFAGGRLYVPVSGVGQEGASANPNTECCTVRGSLVSLDARTGAVVWQAYTIPEAPKVYGKTEKGALRWGPSGASIWVAPTVDLERGAVYVGTGNAFTPPVADTTDAVLAFGIADGRLLWKRQLTAGDLVGSPNAPDVDIGASPILRTVPGGRALLFVGQKSGDVFALKPENGDVAWTVNLSAGGWWGGIEWGMVADSSFLYVPISDFPLRYDPRRKSDTAPSRESGRLVALRLQDGVQEWAQDGVITCSGPMEECHPAKTAAISATPDAIFAGSVDGWFRAYATNGGRLLWEFNTSREFPTVNGVPAKGGSISGPGATIADGMVFVNSGYALFVRGGNVLLAFGPE